MERDLWQELENLSAVAKLCKANKLLARKNRRIAKLEKAIASARADLENCTAGFNAGVADACETLDAAIKYPTCKTRRSTCE